MPNVQFWPTPQQKMREEQHQQRPQQPYVVKCVYTGDPSRTVMVYYGTFSGAVEAVEYIAQTEALGCCGEHFILEKRLVHPSCRIVEVPRHGST